MSESETLFFELSDEEIVGGIDKGSIPKKRGIEELLTRNMPSIFRYLLSKYSLDEELVSDVLGDTAVAILEDYDRYDPEQAPFLYWAFGVARYKLLEALRKKGRYQTISVVESDEGEEVSIYELVDSGESLRASVEFKEFEQKALEAIMSLPELDRLLFLLKSNYDLTYEELANLLNSALESDKKVTPGALAQRLSRAKSRLRETLEGSI